MTSVAKREDTIKRKSQREIILEMLRGAGENGVTNTTFQKVSIRWDARIRELYQEGFEIKAEEVKGGVWKYTLLQEPLFPLPKPKHAMEILLEEIEKKYGGSISSAELKKLIMKKRMNVVRAFGSHKQA